MKSMNGITIYGPPFKSLLILFNIYWISIDLFKVQALNPNNGIQSAALLSGIKLSGNVIEDKTVYPEYKTISGGRAELPCNVTLPTVEDAITLILWFRGNSSRNPIYTYDARVDSSSANGTHFKADVFAGNRASFDVSVRPALLKIDPVLEDDGMEYRCRVDFRWGRTMSTHVFLNVIVPPRSIVIKDSNGTSVTNTVIGPYNQDMDVMLSCLAEGGSPPPALHWYRNNTMIDGSYIMSESGIAQNDLIIYKLSANDLQVMFICQANNFLNYSHQIRAYVSIDINLSPLSVSIVSKKTILSAGRKVEIICQTKGSKPPAVILWYKNNKQLTHSHESISSDGNTTTSVLNLMPTVTDDNALLICRAQNLRLSPQYIEDNWELQVYYDPKVTLTIGKSSKLVVLREGSEAVMECTIKANPIASDIQFLLNGSIIASNEQNGVFISNTTLTIRDLRPEHRGKYRCSAQNLEGRGVSNDVMLDLRYSPICKNSAIKTTIAMTLNESKTLTCVVDAQPSNGVSFYWTFNNYELNSSYTNTLGLSSELKFSVRTAQDFGVISCWAKNDIGLQQHPCLFFITTAVPPSPLHSCIAINKTMTSLSIECLAGDSAGLQQTFFAQVFDASFNTVLVRNLSVSTTNPHFFINGLSSGTEYSINLFALNSKGISKPLKLMVSTLSTVNTKLVSGNQDLDYDPILAVIIGALLSLFLIVLIVIIICKIKQQDEEKDKRDQQIQQNQITNFSEISLQNPSSEERHKNPDVIPCETDRQSISGSKLDLFIINELQTQSANTVIETVLQQKPKSILVNGYLPNGDCINKILKTEGDLRDQLLYYERDSIIVHQTQQRFDDMDVTDVQQTAV